MIKNDLKRQFPILVFLVLFFFCFTTNTIARQLVLSTFAGPPLSTREENGFYDLILNEAFRRAGVDIEIVRLPAERSLANADQGITDGDFVRIAGLEKVYPNLVRVKEKIDDFEFVAFSRHVDIATTSWASLKPYSIAIVRGWKILEKNIFSEQSLVRTKNQRLLFTLLKKDRTDIVIYSRFEGYALLDRLGMQNVHVLEPPLTVREMFLYLNKKHAALAPALENNLREMKRDGFFAEIRLRTLAPYIGVSDDSEE